jgi:hypothetical protein
MARFPLVCGVRAEWWPIAHCRTASTWSGHMGCNFFHANNVSFRIPRPAPVRRLAEWVTHGERVRICGG